jgi:hypothetical protein
MAANLERFRKDLERLIHHGELLEYAMIKEVRHDDFIKEVRKQLRKEKVEAFLKTLPEFKKSYEAWYSECLALLRQLLPDRVDNFIGLYEKSKGRRPSSTETT